MSVLIKSMEMPTCCEECAFVRTVGLDRWKCELSGCDFNSWDVGWGDGEENKYIRHSRCPLVEVSPHGRLIDAGALDINRREEQAWHDYEQNPDNEYLEGVKDGLHETAINDYPNNYGDWAEWLRQECE